MKRVVFLFILILTSQLAFSHTLNSRYNRGQMPGSRYWTVVSLAFEEENYDIDIEGVTALDIYNIPKDLTTPEDCYNEKGTYTVTNENGLEYLTFNSNSYFSIFNKVGLLNIENIMFLAKGSRIILDTFFHDREPRYWPFMNDYTIKTSSYLKEGKKSYNGQSFYLRNYNLIPWVENSPDFGKGQWILFDFSATSDEFYKDAIVDSFLICNGYVNYDKPYLYEANNRVKTFRIVCDEIDLDYTVNIKDTSQLQLITLPRNLGNNPCKVRFFIEDVYKGTKWDDTCITKIIPVCKEHLMKLN